jgi:hypothetical protein
MMEDAPFLNSSFSILAEFPPSFSVSSKIKVSCQYISFANALMSSNFVVKSEAPDVPINTYKDMEEYMGALINRHVESVPIGSEEDLRAEILNGMGHTWRLISPQFLHRW